MNFTILVVSYWILNCNKNIWNWIGKWEFRVIKNEGEEGKRNKKNILQCKDFILNFNIVDELLNSNFDRQHLKSAAKTTCYKFFLFAQELERWIWYFYTDKMNAMREGRTSRKSSSVFSWARWGDIGSARMNFKLTKPLKSNCRESIAKGKKANKNSSPLSI